MNKKVLFLIVFLFLIISVLTLIFIFKQEKNSSPNVGALTSPTPVQIQKSNIPLQVVTIVPDITTTLQSNIQQAFSITFNQPITASMVKVVITTFAMSENATTKHPVQITQSINNDKSTVVIKTVQPILETHTYTVTVSNQATQQILSSVNYISDTIQPSPLPDNNLQLTQYLPYQTKNFKLSYLQSQNVYIFNFIFDPTSTVDMQTQYTNAKNDATAYIKSKGIDLNTIKIEWRYS